MHVFRNNLYNKQKDQDITNIILHKHHIMKKKMKYEKCQGCFLRAGAFRMEEQVSLPFIVHFLLDSSVRPVFAL